LLEDWRHVAPRKNVSGQKQYWQPVDGGGGRSRHHIGRTRSYRCGASQAAQAIAGFGKGCRRMHHSLLVAKQIVGQPGILLERLAHTGNVAMSEDSQTAFEQPMLHPIPFRILVLEEPNDGLRDGEAGCHGISLHFRMHDQEAVCRAVCLSD